MGGEGQRHHTHPPALDVAAFPGRVRDPGCGAEGVGAGEGKRQGRCGLKHAAGRPPGGLRYNVMQPLAPTDASTTPAQSSKRLAVNGGHGAP